MAVITVLEAIREAMREEMRNDERVFIMGEDIGARGGVFLATEGFLSEFGEERIIDTPLAESSIAGIALGAAIDFYSRHSISFSPPSDIIHSHLFR